MKRYRVAVLGCLAGFVFLLPGMATATGNTGSAPWVLDSFGTKVMVPPVPPERIVSLAPSNTEILFALGAGDRVVGVTDYCTYPPPVKHVPRIGGYTNPNVERIVSLEPDLVLAAFGNPAEQVNVLRQLGIPVVTLQAASLDEVLHNIDLVATLIRAADRADQLVSEMNSRIEQVQQRVERHSSEAGPRVLYLVWYPELWVAGHRTFPHSLIEEAGGRNVAGRIDGWAIMERESLLAANPEVIICSGNGTEDRERLREQVLADSQFQKLDAVESGRVYAVREADWFELPGPRIVKGVEEMYRLLWDDQNT